ncbi:MAG: peptide chain release factor N(5)-glutamine methyltransferase [Candidatus Hydrogenedentota bacterium]
METIAQTLRTAAERLQTVTETPRLDAEILLARALGISRAQLLARLKEPGQASDFEAMISRRLSHEPIAYILGEWEFFGLPFFVEPPVLVPRPETEHLVEAALGAIQGLESARVLDIGTGTGCVAIAIACNAAEVSVMATDIREANLELARRNAERHGVTDRVEFRCGDLFGPVGADEKFDVIVSNPPYVAEAEYETLSPVILKHEDRVALVAGPTGLEFVERIIAGALAHLRPGGVIGIELGEGQYEEAAARMTTFGYEEVSPVRDLAGIDRVITGRVGNVAGTV